MVNFWLLHVIHHLKTMSPALNLKYLGTPYASCDPIHFLLHRGLEVAPLAEILSYARQ